jgi:hypothetical protein
VLDVYGTEVTVVVSHNGQGTSVPHKIHTGRKAHPCVSPEEDPLDRELQSKELARIMAASYPRPVVFLGYVVSKPLASRRRFLLLTSFRLEADGGESRSIRHPRERRACV